MRRRLLNLLTALSLLLCVAVAVLWVRSYWASDFVRYTRRTSQGAAGAETSAAGPVIRADVFTIGAGRGSVGASLTRHWYPVLPRYLPAELESGGFARGAAEAESLSLDRMFLGFGYQVFTRYDGTVAIVPSGAVVVPLWFLTPLFGAFPALRLYRRIRRPYRVGFCHRCGYDLRATPQRCPECGHMPLPTSATGGVTA